VRRRKQPEASRVIGAIRKELARREVPPTRARELSPEDQVELLLQRQAMAAQDALDEYVAAVCDPEVLAALRAALEKLRAGRVA